MSRFADPQKSIAVVNEVQKASAITNYTITIITIAFLMTFFVGGYVGIKIKQWCNQNRLDASHHNHFVKQT